MSDRVVLYRFRRPFYGLILLLALAFITPVMAQDSEVLVLSVSGPVTPAMASYFERGITRAEEAGAAAVVIQLDTPGGVLDTTLDIVRLFQAADVPVIVYVAPRGAQAASAGSIITMAAHAAGMAPQTVIGAASPVGEGGVDLPETLFRKTVEDMKATVRGLTQRRGDEAVALAEAMIEEARAVNSSEALEAGLIDVVAADIGELLAEVDGLVVTIEDQEVTLRTAGARRISLTMSVIERILHAVANPNIAGLLLALAIPAILIELSSPGGWVAGFIGVVCLGLGLYGAGQLPVNWLGLGLVIVAFALLLLEVKAPTHGALSLTGTLTMLAGLLVLFNSPGTPEFSRISIPTALAISLSTAAFFLAIMFLAVRAQRRPPTTGREALVGRIGIVRQPLEQRTPGAADYSGQVLVAGELWRAHAPEAIGKGESVIIRRMDGFTLHVERVP